MAGEIINHGSRVMLTTTFVLLNATNRLSVKAAMHLPTDSTHAASNGPTGTSRTTAAVIGLATIPVIVIIAAVGWVHQVYLAKYRKQQRSPLTCCFS